MARARVQNFQFAGFSITFEIADAAEFGRMVSAVERIEALPTLAGWRTQRTGGFGSPFEVYFEPAHGTTTTPSDGPLRKTRKVAAKDVLRDHGFEVVPDSRPIAGQVR